MIFDKDIVEVQYSNILIGFSPFILDGEVLLIRHLTPVEIFEANSLILDLRRKYRSAGMLSEVEILRDLASKGLWTPQDEAEISDIDKKISLKRKTLQNLVLPSQVKSVEGEIRLLLEDVKKKKDKRSAFLSNSYEYKIQQDKMEYLTYVSIYKNTQKRFWKNLSSFENEDREVILSIIEESTEALKEITTPLIRYIARTTDARHRLKVAPPGQNSSVFLLELSQWCNFYDSLTSMSEKPPDNIMENDDLLDGWLLSRRSSTQKSVNTNDGYVSHPGATKQDMEILGGVGREDVIRITEQDKRK